MIPRTALRPLRRACFASAAALVPFVPTIAQKPGTPASQPAPPDPIAARSALDEGRAALRLERFDVALAAFDRARAADPKLFDARVFRAETLFLLERHADAVAAYEEIVAEDPSVAAHLYNFGAALLALGRFDEAERRFSIMAERTPKAEARARATYGVGVAKAERGDEKGARAAFEAALKIDPTLVRAKYRLGVLKLRGGDAPGAVELLSAVVAADPLYDGGAYNLALAYAAKGDDASAATWRRIFVERKAIKNRIDGAKLRLKVEPDDLASLATIARGYAEAQAFEEAERWYAATMRRPNAPVELLTEWATVLDKLGRARDAAAVRARLAAR
jgi:tetratricopeptide (TPR) repeat protein